MIDFDDIKMIKNSVEEFFQKMGIAAMVDVKIFRSANQEDFVKQESGEKKENGKKTTEVVEINIKTNDPQIIIGKGGQTLNDIQRLLKSFLYKKTGRFFYISLDINDYRKKKIEYLKTLARDLADEVSLIKEPKSLSPMPAGDRRIIHLELAGRKDVVTESEGQGEERKIVIRPKLK